MLITTWPYWPLPPVWRMNLPSTFSTRRRIVSRYATCGRPMFASTLNSRFMRSTMISRCSSPMPEMIVCPVSASECTRNVGSSSASFCQRDAQLVLVGLGLRLDRDVDHRRPGTSSPRARSDASSSHSVSPVRVSLRPITAAMSPARTSSISSRLLACICSSRPTRSRLSLRRVVDVRPGVQHARIHADDRSASRRTGRSQS